MRNKFKSGRICRNVALVFATLVTAFSPLISTYEASAAPVTDLTGWWQDTNETGATLTPGGLLLTGTQSQYLNLAVPYDIANDAGLDISDMIDYQILSGAKAPTVQLRAYIDTPGWYGTIVGEDYYGQTDWWKTSATGFCPQTSDGFGSKCHGTLAEWGNSGHDVMVYTIGVKLNGGATDSVLVKSLTVNGFDYAFASLLDTPTITRFSLETTINNITDITNGSAVKSQLTDRGIRLQWDKVAGATGYQAQITSPSGTVTTPRSNSPIIRNPIASEDGLWTFRIRSIYNSGGSEIYSEWSDAYTAYQDSTAPTLDEVTANGRPLDLGDNTPVNTELGVNLVAICKDARDTNPLSWLTYGEWTPTSDNRISGYSIDIPASEFTDGNTYSFTVECYDRDGNGDKLNTQTQTVSFVADNTAPTMYLVENAGASGGYAETVIADGTYYDNTGKNVRIAKDKTDVLYGSYNGGSFSQVSGKVSYDSKPSIDWKLKADGVYAFYTEDEAGNRSDVYTLIIDTVKPVSIINDGNGIADYAKDTITIKQCIDDANPAFGKLRVWKLVNGVKDNNQFKAFGDYAVDQNGCVTYTVDTNSLFGDGEYFFQFTAKDKVGVIHDTVTTGETVTIDNSAPTIKVNLNRNGYINDGAILNVNTVPEREVCDNGNCNNGAIDKIEIYKDGILLSTDTGIRNGVYVGVSARGKLQHLSDGAYIVKAYDKAGNSAEITFEIDNTKPELSAQLDKTLTNGDAVTVLGTVFDKNLKEYQIRIYDSNKTALSWNSAYSKTGTVNVADGNLATLDISSLADGNYFVRVWAEDQAITSTASRGNTTGVDGSEQIYLPFTIDRTAPTGTVTYDPSDWTNGDVTATLKTSEAINTPAGWTKVSDTEFTKVYSSNTLEAVTFTDLAGNSGFSFVRVQKIDKTKPVVGIDPRDLLKLLISTNQDITLRATAFDRPLLNSSGIASIESSFNGAVWVTGKNITVTENGSLCLRATDKAGNVSDELCITIANIDKVAATYDVDYSSELPTWTNQDVVVTVTFNESMRSTAGWTRVDNSGKVWQKTYSANTTETVIFKDVAGNETSVDIDVKNIDKTDPVATITSPLDGALIRGTVDIEIEICEENPSHYTYQIQQNGKAITGWTNWPTVKYANNNNDCYTGTIPKTWDTTQYADGDYTILIAVRDAAGNKPASTTVTVSVDNTAPTATLEYSPTTPTRGDVTVTLKTNEAINTPAGWTKVSDTEFTKVYRNNTDDTFTITDLAGNTTVVTVTVDNIDRARPTGTLSYDPSDWTRDNVTVTLTTNEAVQTPTGWTKVSDTEFTRVYTSNAVVLVSIRDIAGNTGLVAGAVTRIDRIAPAIVVLPIDIAGYLAGTPVNTDLEVSYIATDILGSGVDYVEYSTDGTNFTRLNDNSGTITVTENGTIYVRSCDKVGNCRTIDFEVTRIDKTAPIATVTGVESDNQTITGTVDDTDAEIKVTVNGTEYTAINNGDGTWTLVLPTALGVGDHTISVIATDIAGNDSDTPTLANGALYIHTIPQEGGRGNGDVNETTDNNTPWVYRGAPIAQNSDTEEVLGDTDEENGDINGATNNTDTTDDKKDEGETAESWALLNLLATIVTILIAVGAMIRRSNKESSAYRFAAIAVAAVSVILFIVTENMTLPMTFVDGWSIFMIVLTLVNAFIIAGLIRSGDKDEDDAKK